MPLRTRILPAPLAEADAVPEHATDTPLFLYGTLVDREILERLLGRRLADDELEPAQLAGFRRMAAREAPYPVLVPDPNATVEGFLLRRPTRRDLRRIAHYEDDYRAVLMEVTTVSGERVPAWLHLPREDQITPSDRPLDRMAWDPSQRPQLLALIDLWLAELAEEEGSRGPCAPERER